MATGTHIRTYFEGRWHDGNVAIMHAADHGAWLGSGVFDGARSVNGLTPDLAAHCERVNRSAEAMMLTPTVSTDDMVEIVLDGLTAYAPDAAVYIRPMYWGIDGDVSAIVPLPDTTGICDLPRTDSAGTADCKHRFNPYAILPAHIRQRGLERQGGVSVSQQRPHAGRSAPQRVWQRAGCRQYGQCRRNRDGKYLYGKGW